jgi:hypothetical protein
MERASLNSNLPSWLCIGAQKAGTSWLYQQLRLHPQLWLPPVKELHFFDYLFVPEVREWAGWHIRKEITKKLKWHITNTQGKVTDLEYIHYLSSICTREMFTLPWYKMIFSYPGARGKLCGDVTPEYCMLPKSGITYLLHCMPNVKIIYIIREPTERALSHLRMLAEYENFTPDTKEEQWSELARSYTIKSKSDYQSHITLFDKYIEAKNLLYLPFQMIKHSPEAFLERIEDFLSVKHHTYGDDIHTPVWASKKFAIPESVIEYITTLMIPQEKFIQQRFGQEFFTA